MVASCWRRQLATTVFIVCYMSPAIVGDNVDWIYASKVPWISSLWRSCMPLWRRLSVNCLRWFGVTAGMEYTGIGVNLVTSCWNPAGTVWIKRSRRSHGIPKRGPSENRLGCNNGKPLGHCESKFWVRGSKNLGFFPFFLILHLKKYQKFVQKSNYESIFGWVCRLSLK